MNIQEAKEALEKGKEVTHKSFAADTFLYCSDTNPRSIYNARHERICELNEFIVHYSGLKPESEFQRQWYLVVSMDKTLTNEIIEPWTPIRTKDELTIRDQFAMAAMQGILSRVNEKHFGHDFQFAQKCYEIADLMIKERDK